MKIFAIGDFQGVFPAKLKRRILKEKPDMVVSVGDHAGIDDFKPFLMDLFRRLKNDEGRISPEEFFGKKRLDKLEKKDFEAGKKVFKELNEIAKNIPTAFIFGNTDDGWYRYPFQKKGLDVEKKKFNFVKRMKHLVDLNYRKRKIFGIDFIGFGGYMDTDSMSKLKNCDNRDVYEARKKRRAKSKDKLFKILKSSKNKDKVLVYHYTPKGAFDVIKDRKNPFNGENTGIGFFTEAIKKYKPLFVLCGHMHEYHGMKKLHGVPVVNVGDANEGKAAIIELDESTKKVRVRLVK